MRWHWGVQEEAQSTRAQLSAESLALTAARRHLEELAGSRQAAVQDLGQARHEAAALRGHLAEAQGRVAQLERALDEAQVRRA